MATSPAPVCPLCHAPVPADAPSGACPRCLLAAGRLTGGTAADLAGLGAADVAAKFPDYEILGLLGRGGMGVVWKARHKGLDRLVALKVLPASVAAEPGFSERFQREARALARLSHPHVVAVHEYGERDGTYFLVMELVEGVNLRTALREGRIGPREALRIVPQICDALQYAHDHGVVHRDIKPENVLVSPDGRGRVADFGLAKIVGAGGPPELTLTGQVMGTPVYMAPEQVERPASVDHRADIYSLGVVFYEMLTGELPLGRFDAPSKRIAVDVRLDEVVLRSLEKAPERRWQHASDVRDEVGAIARAPGPAAAPGAGPGARADRAPPTSRLAVAAFVALLAAPCMAGLAASAPTWRWLAAWVGIVLGFALTAGIAAWAKIVKSRGALGGLGYAVPAATLPIVLVAGWTLLAVPMSQAAHHEAEDRARTERADAEAARRAAEVRFLSADGVELGARFVNDDERRWVASLWETARRAMGTPEAVLAADVYAAADVARLKALSPDALRAQGAEGLLGFPLLDPAWPGASVTGLRLAEVRMAADGLSATGVATVGRVRVRFPLTRAGTGTAADRRVARLYFGVGPVVVE